MSVAEDVGRIASAAADFAGPGEDLAGLLATETLGPDEREHFLRIAAALRRPRHLIMLETAREQVPAEERTALNALRRALDAGELGREGVQTALRLGGGSAAEVKRIAFRSTPRE